jgi:Ca2+-binding RTX toxin-like protein
MATFARTNTVLPNANEWNTQTNWAAATVSGANIRITNADGTITEFVGTGLTIDPITGVPTGGTVTSVNLLTSGGVQLASLTGIASLTLAAAKALVDSDTLISTLMGGNDTLNGSAQNEVMYGYAGADTFNGNGSIVDPATGSRGDVYVGGAGADIFNFTGNASNTIVNYALETGVGGITVNLAAGTIVDTFGDTDTMVANSNVNVIMTNGDDSFVGSSGNDFVAAGGGTDTIDGGAGFDDLSYGYTALFGSYFFTGFTKGITVTQSSTLDNAGTVLDPTNATDTFINVESIRGTNFADTFNGDKFDDFFRPMGGNDLVNGGAGNDTVAYDRDSRGGGFLGVTVNLGTGTATDGFGNTDTLISIENVVGTSKADNLTGSSVNNDFTPGTGDDIVNGLGGFDDVFYSVDDNATSGIAVNAGASAGSYTVTSTYYGTDALTGVERIFGTQNADTFNGGTGDDYFVAGLGSDIINGGGGSGFDRLSYYDSRSNAQLGGVIVNFTGLGSGTVTDFPGTIDTFTGIEEVIGTALGDTFNGGASDDRFDGARGADNFNGGGGIDTVTFEFDDGITQGVNVNLVAGTATDGYGFADTLNSIENIYGTNKALLVDNIVGNSANNTIRGYAGNDMLDGGAGVDTIDYLGDFARGGTAAVGVYLSSNVAVDSFGNYDTLLNFENVTGTDVNNAGYNDIIFGNSVANFVDARGGGDIVVAGDGDDIVYGGLGTDAIYGGNGNDTLIGSNFTAAFNGEIDYLISEAGNDTIYVGTAGNAYIDGGSGNDVIFGGSATDYVLSGSGNDTVTLGGGVDLVILYATELVAGEYDIYTDFTDGQDFIYANASLAASASFGDAAGYSYMAINVAGGTHYTIFQGITSTQIQDQIFFNL